MTEKASGSEPKPCDLMVRGGQVLTMDEAGTVYPRGAVAVAGNKVCGVGTEEDILSLFRPRRVIEADGGLVHPGFIDPHYHTGIHLARGAITDNPQAADAIGYFDWINAMDDEDEYVAALASCMEMALHGYTAFMDPGTAYEPDTVARAATAVGIRASVGDPFLWDVPMSEAPHPAALKRRPFDLRRSLDLLGRELWRNDDPDALVHAHISIYGSGTASEELMRAAKACADGAGVVLNMHHNFTPEEAELDDKRFGGAHNLLNFETMGLLGRNTTFIHMNVVREDEIRPIVDSEMSVVWQPGNYQFYGISAQAPLRMPQLMAQGVNVALCVDTAKIWTFGDMELLAYLLARQNGGYIPPEKLLRMRTNGAARAIGLEGLIGSLEPGKRADLVIRSRHVSEAIPGVNPVQEMILVGRVRSADTVIVNGEIVYRKGAFTRIDETAVYEAARASTRRIVKRIRQGE